MRKLPQFSLTEQVSSAIVEQLKLQVENELAVEYYPEKPDSYRLNHANGALLVSYGQSSYPKHDDTFAVLRPRVATFSITIVSRQLYSRYGAVPLVDWVLAMLSGFTPPHCTKPLAPIKDGFDSQVAGLWLYNVEFSTEYMLVQSLTPSEI
ncbi:Gp37 family protein [Acinetobacter sp. c3-l95]|uniref:Gp37 family protein n=1 Tax=Acinetobacter sp. c3-l95 TaxID=3342804 RepID=UPI0035B6CECA